MLLNFFALFVMLIGLFFTLSPRIPGTLIIVGVAFFYSVFTGLSTLTTWMIVLLVGLSLLAEVGGRMARIYLTKDFGISRVFSTDATAGNVAGIVATDALFGPLLGAAIWEIVVGKTFFPRWDMIGKVLVRLTYIAFFRFGCGLIMVVLISKYILR
ncbi:MAG: DUF456 family protein [Negativicutes bacterium]|nr:DUF456 family protein [Negativicutes bacterium]